MTTRLGCVAALTAVTVAVACSPPPNGADEPTASGAVPSSSAAVMMFDTGGQAIGDDKIPVQLDVIEQHDATLTDLDDAERAWSGPAGIELRGTTSRNFPKQSYTFETRDSSGDDLDVGLLGFPPESDWVLYGPYSDKTHIRNVLTYELGRRLDRYQPRTRYVEVFIDDRYDGVYVATERISRDAERVDIDRANPDDPADGGYIIRREMQPDEPQWRSSHPTDWYYHYPKHRNLTDGQRAYLHASVDELENLLASVDPDSSLDRLASLIDVDAWVDYVLLQELARNADAYKKSFYLVKQSASDGGRFVAGPVWDFNVAWGNIDLFDGPTTSGLLVESVGPELVFPDSYPTWWTNLFANTEFVDALACRWSEVRRTVWTNEAIDAVIDDQVAHLTPVRARDDQRWQTIGTDVWPNPRVEDSWEDEVDALRSWALGRAAWLDQHFAAALTSPCA